ncbi:MAG: hypothetical protein JNK02_01200 [Planctomycetes bacterium]|nr:hypothetical protein [Planctomycetota bacterium]
MSSVPPTLSPGELVTLLLLPELLLLAAAIAVSQVLVLLARAQVGAVLAADRRSERRWRLTVLFLCLGVLGWVLAAGTVWLTPVLLCIAGALLLGFTTPSARTAILGVGGVQRGWHARRYESLEEWRLTGDHLRFRLFGEWTAVPCPPEFQADLRAKLTQLAPDRESPFQD